MAQILLPPLMVYAACGLVLSLVVHLLSIFGITVGGERLFFALHIGIFPLWLPVVLIALRMTTGTQRRDFWKMALSGCPVWMKYMTYGFFIYAFVNFAWFALLTLQHPQPKQFGPAVPAFVVHGFSGHWMAFYSAGLAILTTAYRRGIANLQRRCLNGHEIGWNDNYCPTCGLAAGPRRARNDINFALSAASKAGHPVVPRHC